MLFDRQSLKDILKISARSFPLRARKSRYVAGMTTAFASLRSFVHLTWLADELLFSGFKDTKVEAPVFIFANARSGTTLLHHLMSLDEERFTHFKLYQTIFPSVTAYKAVGVLNGLNRVSSGALDRVVDLINRKYFNGFEGIHTLGLDRPEEDECVFLYTMLSPTLLLLFPDTDDLPRQAGMDRTDPGTQRDLMDYYEQVLKRHVYGTGGDRTLLNKNVFTSPRAGALLEKFPDARFVYLVRHPYNSIPSMLNLFYRAWEAHSPEIPKDSPETKALAQLAIDYYRAGLDFRESVPSEQYYLLRYDDLIADPRRAVEGIYQHFQMDISTAYQERLLEACDQRSASTFKSTHSYSLEGFGLTPEFIHGQLGDLFDEFGFER